MSRTYTTALTINFAYDGAALISERDQASYAVLRRYVHGPGSDEPLVWYEGAGTTDRRFLHADERGSVVAISDGAGAVTTINRYDEYGIPAATNAGRFQYTGQTWLPELGMYYYKARIYSPTLGRFMQTDPIGYGDGVNWYNYVGGDPVNFVDPTGLGGIGFGKLRFDPLPDHDEVDPEIVVTACGGDTPVNGECPWYMSIGAISLKSVLYGLPQSILCGLSQGVFSGGKGTVQVGVAGTGGYGPAAVTGGTGLAVDTKGNIGTYSYGGGGVGINAYAGGGISVQGSNADGISNLGGPFFNASASGGFGAGVSIDVFAGPSDGGSVAGGGATLGGGVGLGVFGGGTFTQVNTLVNVKSILGC